MTLAPLSIWYRYPWSPPHPDGFGWNVPTTFGWIAMIFGTHIHVLFTLILKALEKAIRISDVNLSWIKLNFFFTFANTTPTSHCPTWLSAQFTFLQFVLDDFGESAVYVPRGCPSKCQVWRLDWWEVSSHPDPAVMTLFQLVQAFREIISCNVLLNSTNSNCAEYQILSLSGPALCRGGYQSRCLPALCFWPLGFEITAKL